MVWFQCEDCGDNMKKRRLRRHFSMCSATKLSCIDCGNMFGQESVQYHYQCMTEAEKYGPKRHSNGEQDYFAHAYGKKNREKAKVLWDKQKQQSEQPTIAKDNSKQQPHLDINVGLSDQYPWFCSLCNTKTTSQKNLLSHANGKKHRASVKRFDAKQQEQLENSMVDKRDTIENAYGGDFQPKKVDLPVSSGARHG